jgi:hypothetical protein
LQIGTNGAAAFIFACNGFGERMRITSTGELLLGTSNLVAPLTINGGAAFYTQGETTKYNGYGNGIILGSTDKASTPSGGGQGVIGIYSKDASASQLQATMALITDATAANRRLQISIIEQGTGYKNITLAENGGNVGIGIATPVNKLDVTGVSGTNGDARGLITVTDTSAFATGVGGGITFRAKYNTAGAYIDAGNIKGIKENATDGNTASALAFSTQANGGSPTERMRIDSSGNVLIGTTTNTAGNRLAVVGSGIQLSGGTTSQEGVRVQRSSGVCSFTGINNDNNAYNAISFATGASEAMRIDSSGNVLVTNTALLGYGTGSGGTVTQATNKGTNVTLNKPAGRIIMNNASLAAGGIVGFTLANSFITAADNVLLTFQDGTGQSATYTATAQASTGGVYIVVRNLSSTAYAEAIAWNFVVIKGSLT